MAPDRLPMVAAAQLAMGLALGVLGGLMVAGYLGESHVRDVLRPDSWDAVETPLAVAGVALAAAMASQGLRSR